VIRGFINGIVFSIGFVVAATLVAVYSGVVPANADSKPNLIEKWMARTALHVAIDRDTKNLKNPFAFNDQNLTDGVHLYAANCVFCHGASDSKPSNAAQGLYIEAPLLAKDGVEDDPVSESFWKIKHGIRYTAMPSFGKTLTDDDIWKIAMFLNRMDHLPPAVDSTWKAVPSAASPAP
jgi:mono/diheme cytochrome c family protein